MSLIQDGIRLPPQYGQQPKWEKQVVEQLEYFKQELRTVAANVFPNSFEAARTIRLTQKRHHSSGLEWIYAWWGYHGHFVTLSLQCFHQATNVHGLRAAAHGAMVVDELQSMNPWSKTEMAAATAWCQAKNIP